MLAKLVGTLSICLVMAASASAQYGGGTGGTTSGTGGTTTGTPNYTYGSGKAIGIGVGVAAGAAVGIALLIHHRHKAKSDASVIGCTQPTSSGISLKSEDGEVYTLITKGHSIQPGERLEIKGSVKSDRSGTNALRVRDVVTDFGACSATVASTTLNNEREQTATTVK